MLKLRMENKGAAVATHPWELLPEERSELASARADLAMKRGAHRAAVAAAPKNRFGGAVQTGEISTARDEERFARLRMEGLKAELRHAVRLRLTPPELRED